MVRVDVAAVQAERSLSRLSAYQKRLLAMLMLATGIEGFDAALTMVTMRGVERELAASTVAMYDAIALLSWGAIASGVVIWAADRIGRKPALVLSLAAYGACSLATSRAESLAAFTALQCAGRLFMVAQLSLAYVMLSEEMPPALRGRTNGLLGTSAGIGAAVPLALAGLDWRSVFALGALPLALAPLYALALRETTLFAAGGAARVRAGDALSDLRELVSQRLVGRLAAVTAIWFTLSFWSGGVLIGFIRFLGVERAWTNEAIATLPWGTIPAGIAGYLLAGFAMDAIGRRATAMLYLAGSALATIAAHQAADRALVFGAYCAIVALGGAWTVANTLTAELFPTRLRGTAAGIAGSLLGRLGFVVGPLVAGRFSAEIGSSAEAMSLLALTNLACVAVVWRFIPETRGAPLAN
jgi:putative MFS transporter